MFVDVQAKLLFYVVAAWEDDFTGYVIDYGAYPDQKRAYFTLRDAQRTLATAATGHGPGGGDLRRAGGAHRRATSAASGGATTGRCMRIERCLIDANWGTSTDVVYQFCRQSAARGRAPAQPRPVRRGLEHAVLGVQAQAGDRVGHNWRIPNVQGKRAVRHVVFDTNYWKSFVHARLAVPMGDRGCLSLFGDKPDQHRLFAEHLTAEYRVKTEGRGRTVDEWKLRPEASDNHWLDCLVGCAVAASIRGRCCRAPTAIGPQASATQALDLQRNR